MTKTSSKSGRISSNTAAGVAGLMATPARLPNALMRCTVRCKLALPSQWTRKESEPASTNSSRKKSGSETIRCVSRGRHVTRRSEATMGAPIERLGTKCPSMTSTWMRSAPACSASATCSPRRAKSAARIEGASRTRSFRSGGMSLLEDVHELPVPAGDLGDGLLPRRLPGSPPDQGVPDVGAADRESDEPPDAGRRREPLADLLRVLAPTEDDAPDVVAAATARRGHDPLAVLATLEPLDLPDVRLDPGVLELVDRRHHEPRAELQVVGLVVTCEPLELRLLRRHQQLEHEAAAVGVVQIVGQLAQAGGLATVQRGITFRVVAHEDLAEGGMEQLDVAREVVAVFEIELRLTALLGGAGGGVSLRRRVAEDGGAELLVDQDAGLLLGYAGGDGA